MITYDKYVERVKGTNYVKDMKKPMKFIDESFERYVEEIEPYLSLIKDWRNDDPPVTIDKIKFVFSIGAREYNVWHLIPEFNDAIDSEGQTRGRVMEYKAQKDLLEAIQISRKEGKPNAKLLEMQLKRYDKGYSTEGGGGEKSPKRLSVHFENSALGDDDITKKAQMKDNED